MQLAIDVAGFSPAEADQLRRAMGSKRSAERMERLRERLYAGMAAQRHHRRARRRHLPQARRVRQLRLPGEPRDQLRLPGLRQRLAQALPPGGVLRGAAQRPADGLLLAAVAGGRRPPARGDGAPAGHQRQPRPRPPWSRPWCRAGRAAGRGSRPDQWGIGGPVVRLGLSSVRTLGDDGGRADRGRAGRAAARTGTWSTSPGGPALTTAQLEALATADAFACFGLTRREALWAAGAAAQERPDRLPGTVTGVRAPAAARHGRRWTGWSPTCGRPACRRTATRRSSSRPVWTRLGAVPIARAAPGRAGSAGRWSAGWSPTGSGRRPPAGSRSSTWRTRPACSTSSARRGCGSATAGWPGPARRCWCGGGWSVPTG